MPLYYIKFHNESGDHYDLGCYENPHPPTEAQLDALARQELSHEIEDNFLYGSFEVSPFEDITSMPAEEPDQTPLDRP